MTESDSESIKQAYFDRLYLTCWVFSVYHGLMVTVAAAAVALTFHVQYTIHSEFSAI